MTEKLTGLTQTRNGIHAIQPIIEQYIRISSSVNCLSTSNLHQVLYHAQQAQARRKIRLPERYLPAERSEPPISGMEVRITPPIAMTKPATLTAFNRSLRIKEANTTTNT